ncbi:MAG: hypothetical protein V3S55_15385 [Nitrospiraceae bacterium]
MSNEVIQLTQDELRQIVENTVDKAIEETLTRFGIDVDDPLAMQADFRAMREWREASAAIRKKGLMTLVGILVTGSCAMLWLGLTE